MSSQSPLWFALVLCFPALVAASEPSLATWTQERVESEIIRPLERNAGPAMSRAAPKPKQRRVRVLSEAAVRDQAGAGFVPFAIDVRHGDNGWQQNVLGCAYRGSGLLFVKVGEGYRPAEFLLGKNVAAVPNVCVGA